MEREFLTIKNGERVNLNAIPHLPFEQFHAQLIAFVEEGGHIVHYFAYEDKGQLKLIAVLREKELVVVSCDAPESYASMTANNEQFHMFEREIAEQYGIKVEGHPWMKHVRYHSNYAGKEDVFGNDYSQNIPGKYDYFSIEGDNIHEVAVGPIHAGIIEPGHFRFNCLGEKVLHLEIQLGYQHRGVEKMLVTSPRKRLPIIIEGIAGDTSIGNSLCYSQAIEALASIEVDEGAKIVRGIALELERISNHIGDLGALSGDVAFLAPAAYFGRMRGEFLNLLLVLSGNRFGKGLVRPGGVVFPMVNDKKETIKNKIKEIRPETEHVGDLLMTSVSVLSRFELAGAVATEIAEKIGMVGVAGRASGIDYDVRRDFPTENYVKEKVDVAVEDSGNVSARAKVRMQESLHSLDLIDRFMANHLETTSDISTEYSLAPSSFVVTLNEGWRGELSHCLITDEDGSILRYKVKDPSFHNWTGLAMSLRDQEISDFPICNKSFNLSYCGFDL